MSEASTRSSSYQVRVRNLLLPCSIGIYDHERDRAQRVRFNVELDVADPGSFTDEDLSKILNYERIVGGIKALIGSRHFGLVETLAECIAALCLEDRRALRVSVSVEKLDVICEAESVGIAIVRDRVRAAPP
jgi:7,8-dihydroneopterin aldolase/epimerase/oxygenase